MKTSIFNMTFTLPPLVEMHEVEKDMPTGSAAAGGCNTQHTALGCPLHDVGC